MLGYTLAPLHPGGGEAARPDPVSSQVSDTGMYLAMYLAIYLAIYLDTSIWPAAPGDPIEGLGPGHSSYHPISYAPTHLS